MSDTTKINIKKSDFKSWKNLFSTNNRGDTYFITHSIFRSIITNSNVICIATDENGIIQLFNHGAELKLGYRSVTTINKVSIADICDREELISRAHGLSKEFGTPVNEDFNALTFKAFKNRYDHYTLSLICKNKSSLKVDVSVSLLQDTENNIRGYLIICTENFDVPYVNLLDKEIDKRILTYIENAPLGVFIVDNLGNYLFVNKVASKSTGYSEKELLQMNRRQLLHPGDPLNTMESFHNLLGSGHAIIDTHIVTMSGVDRYWRVNVIKIHGERYMGFVNDITDQIETQQELQKTNKYLETIVENIPNMLFLKDAEDLSFVQFNKGGEVMTGLSRDEMLGKNDFDFFPYEQAEFFRNKDREVLNGKSAIVIEEEKIQTRHKGERILHTKKIPVLNAKGIPEFLLGISEDITDLKVTEREFLQKKLELDNFFNLSPNFLCIANLDLSFTRLNLVWEQLLGFSIEELSSFNFLDLVHPDEAEQTKDALSRLTQKKALTGYQIRIRCNDDSYLWVEWHFVLTGDQIYAIGRDITKKIQNDIELEKSKVEAEAANHAKSDFLANMSHEIRNPLNAIIGFAELMHKNVKDEKLLLQITSIRNSGKVLLGLLNDILDLSKIEAGKMKLELEPVNLNSLIKDIENMFSQKIQQKGLSFCVEKDRDISYKFMLDEVRLRQILFNIIGNAVKFTEKGYICLYLNKVFKTDDFIDLTISIEDTGIGIPKEQQQLIFETFQQQDGQSTKKYGGTGLGLSISKRLAEMMGGNISVISEPGKGSIFKIFIPDIKVKPDEENEAVEVEYDPNSIEFGNSTVLIVDDTELNLDLMVMTLENSKLVLLTARNGLEAVEMAHKHHPHLILMDLRMPVMNGYDATRRIKNDPETNTIPIVAISASTDLDSKTGPSENLFDGFLMKPLKINDLFDLLKKFLPYIKTVKPPFVEKTHEKIYPLSDEQKYQLDDVITILENDFLPINESVIKKQLIDQIGDFGKGLVLFGEANSLSIITDYGNKICQHVENFEIDKMMKTLKLFPTLIEKIKSLAKSESD